MIPGPDEVAVDCLVVAGSLVIWSVCSWFGGWIADRIYDVLDRRANRRPYR